MNESLFDKDFFDQKIPEELIKKRFRSRTKLKLHKKVRAFYEGYAMASGKKPETIMIDVLTYALHEQHTD